MWAIRAYYISNEHPAGTEVLVGAGVTRRWSAGLLPDGSWRARFWEDYVLVGVVCGLLRPLPYFRGKYRILNALVPAAGIRRACVFGFPMDLNLSHGIERALYGGWYEVREMKYARTALRPGAVCVDIGANVSAYTAFFRGSSGRLAASSPSSRASTHTSTSSPFPGAPTISPSGLAPWVTAPAY